MRHAQRRLPTPRPAPAGAVPLALALLAVAACSGDSTAPPEPDTERDTRVQDTADSDAPDLGPRDASDVAPRDAGTVDRGDYGEPCRSNLECASGFCVPGPSGFVCTERCTETCPDMEGVTMSCQPIVGTGADRVRVCVPASSGICAPCLDDLNCPGGACVQTDDGAVCGRDCDTVADCPDFMNCFRSIDGVPLEVPQCLPETLSCSCDDAAEGQTRACARRDGETGRVCTGVEICDPVFGWVDCDAQQPVPEECNGIDDDCDGLIDEALALGGSCETVNEFGACPGLLGCAGVDGPQCRGQVPAAESCDRRDNDCDGLVDEDFVDAEGRYVDDANCGTCGNDCTTRYPAGWVAECAVVAGAATCVVVECPPGFVRAGDFACVPLESALCTPCGADADCNAAVGDRCLGYGELGGFCGRDCSEDAAFGSECPDGYSCDAGQCRRTTGSCGCDHGDDFLLACRLASPLGEVCVGVQQCTDGALGTCVPPDEVCDGFDNDCDGVVDDPFVDERGAYTLDAHCGRCFNDCGLLLGSGRNATGVCVDGACAPSCAPGYVDADRLFFNGCECRRISVRDMPDPAGTDSNCDGIDGEVARGVFVAPTGADGNPGTREAPLATVAAGIAMAAPGGRDHVYVAAGVYPERVRLREGVSVFGGYGPDFSVRDIVGNETALIGPADGGLGTVVGVGIASVETIVDGFTIVGADAVALEASSYAVHLSDCGAALTVSNNTIRGGRGGAGLPGTRGGAGAAATGGTGAGDGLPANTAGGTCPSSPTTSIPGGGGARFTCPDYAGTPISTAGGDGASSTCPAPNAPQPAGASGATTTGAAAGLPATAGGTGGPGGYSLRWDSDNPRVPATGACQYCGVPTAPTATIEGQLGANGARGAAGLAGAGCSAGAGLVVGGRWTASAAGAGGRGGPGSGGGGGGAGGGVGHCTQPGCSPAAPVCIANDQLGGGGAGGGAGGCGGEGGGPGTAGGGSFAVFVVFETAPDSLPDIDANIIRRGRGGAGGDGGPGGDGGIGSEGGVGTPSDRYGCPGQGGNGGDGGPGGSGGGGGGGCGGPSVGVFVGGPGASPLPPALRTDRIATANAFPASGARGEAGEGGPSSGRDGADAAPALYEPVLPCPDRGAAPCR